MKNPKWSKIFTKFCIPTLLVGLFVLDRVIKKFYVETENFQLLQKNRGIAFDIPITEWLLWPMLAIVLTYIGILLIKSIYKKKYIESIIFSTLLLGAASNVIDRIVFGGIIDYIYFSDALPVFNIADLLITGSIILWLVMML